MAAVAENHTERLRKLARKLGLLRPRDLESAGIPKVYLKQLAEHRFLLQEVPPIEPIPLRPPSYFANCNSQAETQEDNRLAKSSSIRPPKDLE